MSVLKVGDKVIWAGAWADSKPSVVTVTGIELKKRINADYGDSVESVKWEDIALCTIDLDNDHWAYGVQIKPLDT